MAVATERQLLVAEKLLIAMVVSSTVYILDRTVKGLSQFLAVVHLNPSWMVWGRNQIMVHVAPLKMPIN